MASKTKPAKKLDELLEGMDVAMMVTHARNKLHGRPMHIAARRDGDAMYFATSIDSPKANEIGKDPDIALVLQKNSNFVFMEGKAAIVEDRRLIDELWSEAWKVWFPKGKDDPKLCLVRFEPRSAAYWDNSGAQGVSYAFSAVKAYMTGKTPSEDKSLHGEVKYRA